MEKKDATRITNLLLRSHDRFQGFMYTGLDGDGFLLGSENEDDFRFGLAEQTIARLRLQKSEDRDLVSSLLSEFNIRMSDPAVVDLRKVFSHATKHGFDRKHYLIGENTSGLYIQTGKKPDHYAVLIESRFTEIRMRQAFQILDRISRDENAISVPLDTTLFETARVARMTIKAKGFRKRSIVLQKGRDVPVRPGSTSVLRLSREGKGSWRFGGHLSDDDIDLLILRPNLLLT